MANFFHKIMRTANTQFDLQLSDLSSLKCQKIVRLIPNKRLVCSAVWQHSAQKIEQVFVKIFIGNDAQKYAKRDADGIALMLQEQIATPKPLYIGAGTLQDGTQVQVIVLEEIKSAQTADALMPSLAPQARFELAKNLIKAIAHLHWGDLIHADIHLKNFLITEDASVYTLDGDGVRQHVELDYVTAHKNLALLLSKFDALDQTQWFAELLKIYVEVCPWVLPLKSAKIARWAHEYRLKAVHDYADKKVFRNCTDVQIIRQRGNFLAINTDFSPADMAFTADALDDLIAQSNSRLKNGNSATVIALHINDQAFALKRYNIKDALHGLKRALQPSRAAVSWANAHRLQLLGIATPKPAMMLEVRKLGMRRQAYFISEYLDVPDAIEFFAQTRDALKRAEAVRNICTLFYKLLLLQISHGDMKATNIKMHGTHPVLIDLDSMRQHKRAASSRAAHIGDLQRFMQNWIDDIPLYNAFVKTFKVVYPNASILEIAGLVTNKELTE